MSHRIGLIVFDGMMLLDASGPAEVFHHAELSGEHYDIARHLGTTPSNYRERFNTTATAGARDRTAVPGRRRHRP